MSTPDYAWVYDYPVECDGLIVDGDVKVFRDLGIALSLLTVKPTKIIYLPKGKHRQYLFRRRDLIITSCNVQFRYSEWFNIRKQIGKQTRIENYVYNYDEEKLMSSYLKIHNNRNIYVSEQKKLINKTLKRFWVILRFGRIRVTIVFLVIIGSYRRLTGDLKQKKLTDGLLVMI